MHPDVYRETWEGNSHLQADVVLRTNRSNPDVALCKVVAAVSSTPSAVTGTVPNVVSEPSKKRDDSRAKQIQTLVNVAHILVHFHGASPPSSLDPFSHSHSSISSSSPSSADPQGRGEAIRVGKKRGTGGKYQYQPQSPSVSTVLTDAVIAGNATLLKIVLDSLNRNQHRHERREVIDALRRATIVASDATTRTERIEHSAGRLSAASMVPVASVASDLRRSPSAVILIEMLLGFAQQSPYFAVRCVEDCAHVMDTETAEETSFVVAAARRAAETGHMGALETLVSSTGGEKLWTSRHDIVCAALLAAASSGQDDVVEFLVGRCGADPRAENDMALQIAASKGRVSTLRVILFLAGFAPATEGRVGIGGYGSTALVTLATRAAMSNNVHAFRLIVEEFGAECNANVVLCWAAYAGSDQVIPELIDRYGADVHAGNGEPLRWACDGGSRKVVRLLSERYNADPSADRYACLRRATVRGDADVVEELLRHMYRPCHPHDNSTAPSVDHDEIRKIRSRDKQRVRSLDGNAVAVRRALEIATNACSSHKCVDVVKSVFGVMAEEAHTHKTITRKAYANLGAFAMRLAMLRGIPRLVAYLRGCILNS